MTETTKKQPMKTIGRIPCLCCGEVTPLKEQSTGLAAMSCNWCGLQAYSRAPASDKILRKEMKPLDREAPAVSPAATVAETKSEPKKKSGSLLENL